MRNVNFPPCEVSFFFFFVILVFGKREASNSFSNHFGIIYDLCWSLNRKELLPTSAEALQARCSITRDTPRKYTGKFCLSNSVLGF